MKWILVREDNGLKVNLSAITQVHPVGRGKDCLIKCQSLYASRVHCNIIWEENKIYVVDLKSSNGTFVNRSRIPTEKRVVLNENDLIGVGVPEVIDEKSVVYKLVLKNEESPVVQNTVKLDGNRKRNIPGPISIEVPVKIICLDDECVLNSSSPQISDRGVVKTVKQTSENVLEAEPASISPPPDCNPLESVNVSNQNNGDSSASRLGPNSSHPMSSDLTRRDATEVIDLVESDDDQISSAKKDEKVSKARCEDEVVFPSTSKNSGYADENDVIVISDDEDFFSFSQVSEDNGGVERDDLSPTNELSEKEPEKNWEISESDDESSNDWWPKLSQSFSENTQEDSNEKDKVSEACEKKTLSDEIEGESLQNVALNEDDGESHGKISNVGKGEGSAVLDVEADDYDLEIDENALGDMEDDENASVDVENDGDVSDDKENPSGDWFPVLSQGFSESDDDSDDDEEEEKEEEEEEEDKDQEEKEEEEEEEDKDQEEKDEVTSMQIESTSDTHDIHRITAKARRNIECASSMSECTKNLSKIRMDNELFENKRDASIVSDTVSSVRNDMKQDSKTEHSKQIQKTEHRLSSDNRSATRGPLIINAPTLKRGKICVWDEGNDKEAKSSVLEPVPSSSSVGSEADVKIKACSVILEDVMYGKVGHKLKTKGKSDGSDRRGKHFRKKKSATSRSRSLSKDDRRKIKEERRLKLQALSDKGLKEQSFPGKVSAGKEDFVEKNNSLAVAACQETDKVVHPASEISKDSRHGKVAAKVTDKNRGAFLAEFDQFPQNVVVPNKKGKQQKKKDAKSVIISQKNILNPDYKLAPLSPEIIIETETTFAQNTDSLSSGVKNDPRKKPAHMAANKSSPGILKSSNHGKNGNLVVRKVCFNEVPEIRMFAVSPGMKMMPVKGKDYPLRPILEPLCQSNCNPVVECSPVMLVIYDICCWNTQWLEEQRSKPSSQPPPVHHNFRILPILGVYSSYQEYYTCFYPIMMYEMWAKIYKGWDQNFASSKELEKICSYQNVNLFRHPLVQVLLESHKDVPDSSYSAGQEFVLISSQCVITENVAQQYIYPKVGDLCILELTEEVTSPMNETLGQTSIVNVRVFAYVESMRRNLISSKFNISQCFGDVQLPAYILHLNLKLKKRPQKICFEKMARLKVVCQLLSELRGFEALLDLPKSPLMQHILDPGSLELRTFIPGNVRIKSTDLLNPSQEKAVAMAKMVCLAQEPRICLIQGPPGTGKTKVIVSLLMELFAFGTKTLLQKRRDNKTPRILLCAPSNAAIDNLVIKLLAIRTTLEKENRFRLVRVGRLEAMNPAVRDISLQELTTKEINSNSNNADADSLDLQISTIEAKVNSTMLALESVKSRKDVNSQKNVEAKLNEYLQKLNDARTAKVNNNSNLSNKDKRNLEVMAERNVLRCADIVATTLASSANNSMIDAFYKRPGAKPHFSCCIIDEACQSLEADTLIPLKLGIINLVLVGDQEQLFPTVLSLVAKQNGLQTSLFERLWSSLSSKESSSANLPMVLLNVQYRMHPEICYWPNLHVYNGVLETPPDLKMERQSPFLPYVIISLEFDQNDPNQLLNCNEAELVSKLYFAMYEKAERRSYSIGIITPYQKQKNAIELALLRRRLCKGKNEVSQFEVNTIDSFQGQERDIILLSCVRSYGIGFLGQRRRINVALTRARRSLVVCGNFNSLKDHELWNAFLADGLSRGVVKCISGSNVPNQKDLLNLVLRNPCE